MQHGPDGAVDRTPGQKSESLAHHARSARGECLSQRRIPLGTGLRPFLELGHQAEVSVLTEVLDSSRRAVGQDRVRSVVGELVGQVDGIELEFGLSITNLSESSLNQKMIESAQKVIVLADYTKFNRRGLGRICGLDQVDFIVTDDKAPEKDIKYIEERGIKVVVAK